MLGIFQRIKLIHIPIFLLLLSGLLMMGLTDYIKAGFDIDKIIKNPDFFINLGTTNLGIFSIIIAILLIKIEKFKSSNETYLDTIRRILTFRKEKYKAPVFSKFSFEKNTSTKKIYYRDSINKKMQKLKPSAKDLDILYAKSNNPDPDLKKLEDEKFELARKKNRYCKKIRHYEKIISEDYINKNIHRIYINYPKITVGLIFSGIKVNANGELIDYVTKYKQIKVFKDLFPKFLLSFAFTVIFAGLTYQFKGQFNLETLFVTAGKMFAVALQIYFTINYAERFNQEVTLHDAMFRWDTIEDYELWESLYVTEKERGVSNG